MDEPFPYPCRRACTLYREGADDSMLSSLHLGVLREEAEDGADLG